MLTATTAIIYDAMFVIITSPIGTHRTFADYATFLIQRWITPWYRLGIQSVHLVFDHPNVAGVSPKDLLREQSDAVGDASTLCTSELCCNHESITGDMALPKSWRKFLSCRKCKRMLVNFITTFSLFNSLHFLRQPHQAFVTGGGLDGDFTGKALGTAYGDPVVKQLDVYASDAEEADFRVWRHAAANGPVVVYSPDTDTYHVALSGREVADRSIAVQLDMPGAPEQRFLLLSKLAKAINGDPDLAKVPSDSRLMLLQALFVLTGCDYLSYFSGISKLTFYKIMFQ
eukprot:scpid47964/ scgid21868/ 